MHRALFSAVLKLCLICGVATAGWAQGVSSHRPVRRVVRADLGISSAKVQIAASTMAPGSTSMEVGSDTWNARGFDLKTLIAQVYDVDVRRVDLPDETTGDARYDVTLALPREATQETIQRLLQDALKKKFGLAITPEDRPMDVYVMTAPNGPGAGLHRHISSAQPPGAAVHTAPNADGQDADKQESWTEDAQQISYIGRNCSGVSSGNGIKASGAPIPEFRRTLEPDLDRMVIDETKLQDSYDFEIGAYANKDELFKLLRDQLGIVVTPAQRKVTVLAVRPAGEMRASGM